MEMPIIPAERGEDIHGLEIMERADLVVFMAGNQFMAMPALIEEFKSHNPYIEHIFVETLPPRLELNQILAGGARFGEVVIDVVPDVYTSVSAEAVSELARAGFVEPTEAFVYLHNRLAIMTVAGNPLRIREVADLARDDVRVSQPNPAYEDIARHIVNMYVEAGGQELERRIMVEKVEAGTTLMTTVHHRETPERIEAGIADAGPVWATEIAHAIANGRRVTAIEVGEALDQHGKVEYFACPILRGKNRLAGEAFCEFLRSTPAQAIYADYGFTPEFPID
jgi:ABC-type molybdate transport system substrate-binding protein